MSKEEIKDVSSLMMAPVRKWGGGGEAWDRANLEQTKSRDYEMKGSGLNCDINLDISCMKMVTKPMRLDCIT